MDVAGLQANCSFSRFLALGTLSQLDTAGAQAASANIRLRYNYRPDSDLYVIYNAGTRFASLAAANPQQLREQRFAVKFTYSFSPVLHRARAAGSRPNSSGAGSRRPVGELEDEP